MQVGDLYRHTILKHVYVRIENTKYQEGVVVKQYMFDTEKWSKSNFYITDHYLDIEYTSVTEEQFNTQRVKELLNN